MLLITRIFSNFGKYSFGIRMIGLNTIIGRLERMAFAKMRYAALFYMASFMFLLTSCFFFRKDKDPEKVVKDMNKVVDQVLEQVDSLEEKTKEIIEEELEGWEDSVVVPQNPPED